jgi:hypothetical protein
MTGIDLMRHILTPIDTIANVSTPIDTREVT